MRQGGVTEYEKLSRNGKTTKSCAITKFLQILGTVIAHSVVSTWTKTTHAIALAHSDKNWNFKSPQHQQCSTTCITSKHTTNAKAQCNKHQMTERTHVPRQPSSPGSALDLFYCTALPWLGRVCLAVSSIVRLHKLYSHQFYVLNLL